MAKPALTIAVRMEYPVLVRWTLEIRMRRFGFFVLALALWAPMRVSTLQAQVPSGSTPGIRHVVDRDDDILKVLDEARDLIEKKQYHSAVQLLQLVLDRPEDSFRERNFLDDHGMLGGTRKEAQRLLSSMPSDGQVSAYELEYGTTARLQFETALVADDLDGVTEVARRFAMTAAGYDATLLLAAVASDRDQALQAALLLEPMRYHPRRTPQLALQRAVYWSRAGRVARGVAALRELKRTVSSGQLRIGGREVKLPADDEAASKWLQPLIGRKASIPATTEWLMSGGGPTRNASAAAASPAGGNTWRVSTLEHLVLDGPVEDDQRHRTRLQEVLDEVQKSVLEQNQPNVPAAQPLVIGDIVIYRTVGDLTAVNLQTGKLVWRSSMMDASLTRMLNPRSMETRIRASRSGNPQMYTLAGHLERRVFRDLAAGTLSSDSQTVFALEDLDSSDITMNGFGLAEPRPINKLVAYDLAGGRMLWEVGGQRGSPPVELSGQYFMGPPLPFEDRLYVISEAQGALELLVLKQAEDRQSVKIDWSQTLIAVDLSLSSDPLRRLSGLSPSMSDGVVVCPTSTGAVVAIDLARRALLWGFQYPSLVQTDSQGAGVPAFPAMRNAEFLLEEADKNARWIDNTPLIAEGKVLIAPRDSNSLYCLDLVDGHEIWKLPRDEWMYVACAFEGRAVLVGRHGLGAVTLADGTPLDSFADADVEPTGRGVRVGSTYYLPTARGEIATIDLRSGHVMARSKLPGGLIPGNLAAGDGAIVSLSATDVLGFARLSSVEDQIAQQLQANARNPQALALRGELRLHNGQQESGLADLRESLRLQPDSRVKLVLASALLSAVRAEPARIRANAAELEAITDDPQQRNEFLRLYSHSLEAMGDHKGAFAQMIRLAETAGFLDELKPVETGYSVRTDRSVRARLIEMSAAASAADRVEMNRMVQQQIRKAADDYQHPESLDRCLQFFRGLPTVDTELLRVALELKGKQRGQLLKSLEQSSDPAVAGRVIALQCADLIESESWVKAAAQIKSLRRDFGDQVCLDGKTGRSLADAWSAKPDLARLLTTKRMWPEGSIEAQRINRNRPVPQGSMPVEVVSRSGAALAGWSFEADPLGAALVARDETGSLQWTLALPTDSEHNDPAMRGLAIPFQLHIQDNWLLLSRMTYFLVIENLQTATGPRIVWHQSLKIGSEVEPDIQVMRRINGRFIRTTPSRVGQVIGLTRETVVYAIGSKVLGAELQTGRLAWSRHEAIGAQFEASADDRTVAIQSGTTLTLLRTLDGSRLARKSPPAGMTIWTRGGQRLLRRTQPGGLVFELIELDRESVVWSQECPRDTLATVIDDEDLALLQPGGQLLVLRLADKRERYQVELPIKPDDKSWFTVQRSTDGDIVLGGESYRHRSALQLIPFETGSQNIVPFDGHVCAVSPTDGRLLWSTPVEKAALEPTQPSNLPVLLLATRQFERGGNSLFQRFRMTAYVIDKRTGRKTYTTEESAPALAPRLEPQSAGRLFANFHDWYLELTIPAADQKPQPIPSRDTAR